MSILHPYIIAKQTPFQLQNRQGAVSSTLCLYILFYFCKQFLTPDYLEEFEDDFDDDFDDYFSEDDQV